MKKIIGISAMAIGIALICAYVLDKSPRTYAENAIWSTETMFLGAGLVVIGIFMFLACIRKIQTA